MNRTQRSSQSILAGAFAALSVGFSLLIIPSDADARPLGRPRGNSSTGAVRGGCTAQPGIKNRQLLTLVNSNASVLTAQGRPTLWFYIPFGRDEDVTTVEFELLDEDQNPVLKNKTIALQLPDKPGIAKFTLPTTEQPLTPGKEYFWVLRVMCDSSDFSSNPTISGWIKRVQPSPAIANQLKSTPPQNQYTIYAKNQMWFEQISSLAEHRTKQRQEWSNLLSKFNLKDFVQAAPNELRPVSR